jgi:cytochrome c553
LPDRLKKMPRRLFRRALAIFVLVFQAGPSAAAGDAIAGKRKATMCQTCHGFDGMAKLPDAPNLAGQNPVYLVKALNDYKSGARKHAVMSVAASTLSPEDMADLAAYYSSIRITVEAPK